MSSTSCILTRSCRVISGYQCASRVVRFWCKKVSAWIWIIWPTSLRCCKENVAVQCFYWDMLIYGECNSCPSPLSLAGSHYGNMDTPPPPSHWQRSGTDWLSRNTPKMVSAGSRPQIVFNVTLGAVASQPRAGIHLPLLWAEISTNK